MDLVGIEPTTLFHAMEEAHQPEIDCKAVNNRRIGKNRGVLGDISGQFPANRLNKNSRAAWAGVHAGRLPAGMIT